MKGPTMRLRAEGSARRTLKPSPRSAVRGPTTLARGSHRNLSPGAGSWPGKKLMDDLPCPRVAAGRPRRSGQRDELLALHRRHQAVERLVHLGPARQLLHIVEPAPDVRIGR